jgi:hypothetical protein
MECTYDGLFSDPCVVTVSREGPVLTDSGFFGPPQTVHTGIDSTGYKLGSRRTLWRVALLLMIQLLFLLPHPEKCPAGEGAVRGEAFAADRMDPRRKHSMLEGRCGYLWGWNEVRFRDGDNGLIRPSRRLVTISGPVFEADGETFVRRDVSLRLQGSINLPTASRDLWRLGSLDSTWDTEARIVKGDISAAYHFGPISMPYSAGLVAGYRYYNLLNKSDAKGLFGGSFTDNTHLHVPYFGICYSHTDFGGSLVRLDVLVSPLTMATMDWDGSSAGPSSRVDGHSIMGTLVEVGFRWSTAITQNILAGAFAKYTFMDLSGGATVETTGRSTRFSLDGTSHLFVVGGSTTFTF